VFDTVKGQILDKRVKNFIGSRALILLLLNAISSYSIVIQELV